MEYRALSQMLKAFLLFAVALALLVPPGAFASSAQEADGDELRVMSFNIRYGTANDGANRWTNRRELVFDVLREHDCDVVGLQEALRFQIDEMREAVPPYGEIGVGRDDGKTRGEYSGILYRTDRLKVTDSGTFWLSDTPAVPGSITWGNACTRICTWGRFVRKGSGKAFYLFNVHLDHRSQPSREKSAVLLARRIGDRKHNDPVIVTGDFNAGESNPAIRYLKGQFRAEGADLAENPIPLVDTFRLLHPEAADVGTFNGFKGTRSGEKIDYVFTLPGVPVLQAEILRDNKDGQYPSDHFPVMARLALGKRPPKKRNARALRRYRRQLGAFRKEFRVAELPDVTFFLFGMGNRSKWLYKDGALKNALTGTAFKEWSLKAEAVIPNAYRVELQTSDGRDISIYENEAGVFVAENGRRTELEGTRSRVRLPSFQGHKYSEILKVLHQEILINIVDSKPVPNFFVYKKPWRRDAAMMAMCLERTGNLDLIRDWVLGLDEPYDYNNGQKQGKPESEADNLGQTLYLLSLFADKNHPLVQKIVAELPKYEVRDEHGFYIKGRSDFQYVPVYQTKWLKFGLRALGLDDPYTIPAIEDNYSSLFWWEYKDDHVAGGSGANDRYPYIGWARDHFHGAKNNPISNRDYPLTWETEASQADYPALRIVDPVYVERRTSAPHTWHAAEVFLYLMDT